MSDSDDIQAERQVRAARNESLLRESNERLEEMRDRTQAVAMDYFCECARPSCADTVVLSPEQYEHVRSEGDQFFVIPGHVAPEVEHVVEKYDSYWVVEKLGPGRYVAEALDPRS